MNESSNIDVCDRDRELKLAAIREHGAYVSAPTGTSMRPMLHAGRDTVVIVAPKGRLRKYDVALFCHTGRHILHRVVRVTENGYVFRGDNCTSTEVANDSDVIGVMSEFYRGEKKIPASALRYRLYSRYIVASFPIRHLWRRIKAKLKIILKRKKKD